EDGERGHIREEERKQKDELAERAIGQEIIFRRMLADFASKSEDPDVDDNGQIGEDEEGWDHWRRASSVSGDWGTGRRGDGANGSSSPCPPVPMSPSPSSRRAGQASLTSSHINAEIASV